MSVLVAGCSDDADDSDADDDRTSTTITSNGTTSTIPVEQEVEQAYLAYWAMLDRLAQDPNPDDPEITQRATGDALAELTDFVTEMKDAGWRGEFGEQHSHEVLSVDADDGTAQVEHCAIDDSSVIDTSTGQGVGPSDEGVTTHLYKATLEESVSGWQVETISEEDNWPGAGDCS
jgi:hypothetical protein